MSAATPMVELDGVSKRFGATVALETLSFSVHPGEMFGVIGPDGAGKTTTLRLICGLLPADGGSVHLLGSDPARQRSAATHSIGYVSQRFSLYGDLSIDENIAFFASIHGVRRFADRRTRLLELTGLLPFRDRRADRLSGGMKQKLALACTLVHEPRLLVLDEPTTGVDPVSRREFWKLLAEFLSQGLTIVMATPYLDEAERCSRVALLNQGRLLALDEPSRLQASSRDAILEIVATPPRQALRVLRDLDRVAYVRFASVYRDFQDVDEFERELALLEGRKKPAKRVAKRTSVR
jgi:ABC-2 type transport system ATP-binding protein